MMLKKLARKILKHELDSMTDTIESLRESNNTLRNQVDDFADIKLRLRVAEMYINDNDAIDELLEAKKEKESAEQSHNWPNPLAGTAEARAAAARAAAMGGQGYVGMFGSNLGALSGSLLGGRYG